MATFNKKLLAARFITLATLLIASHYVGAAAPCESRTGIMCMYVDMCGPICLQRAGGYTGGYVVGDPSCVCTKPCATQSTTAKAAVPGEKQPAGGGGDAGSMGMAN